MAGWIVLSPCFLTLPTFSPGRLVCNLDIPEATAPFYVYPIANIPGVIKTEARFEGFCIQIKGDIRWIVEDEEVEPYAGQVWKEDGILFKVPAYEYSLLHCKDEIDRANGMEQYVIDSMDDAHHYFEENKSNRLWQYYYIEFPAGVTLSLKEIFSDAEEDDELDYEVVKVESTGSKFPRIVEHWLHFYVARTDVKLHKQGKVTKKTKKSKATGKLAGLMSTTP